MNLTEVMQQVKRAREAGDEAAVERLTKAAIASIPKAQPRSLQPKQPPAWERLRKEQYAQILQEVASLRQENTRLRRHIDSLRDGQR